MCFNNRFLSVMTSFGKAFKNVFCNSSKKTPVDLSTSKLNIYTRTGKLVSSSNSNTLGWNGKVQDDILDDEVFLYTFSCIGLDKSEVHISGTIQLIK